MTPTRTRGTRALALAPLLALSSLTYAQAPSPHALLILPGEMCDAIPCTTHGLFFAGWNLPGAPADSAGVPGFWWSKPGIYARNFNYKSYICELHMDVSWFPWDPVPHHIKAQQLARQNDPWRPEYESAAWQIAQVRNPTPERIERWVNCVPPRLQIDGYMYDLGAAALIMFETPAPSAPNPQPSIGIWSFMVGSCVHETTGLPVYDDPTARWRLNLAGKSLPAVHWQFAGNPNDPTDDHNYLFVRTAQGDVICSGWDAESRRPGVKDLDKIFADGFDGATVFADGFER